VLQCVDHSFYVGITNDFKKRLKAHDMGKAARYTAGRLPVKLVYCMGGYTEGAARKEEFRIKKLSRKQKESLGKI